jgi:putative ABC transport system permease protein
MSTFSFILASARHYSRAHLGLLFGAFLASAILTGSLLVGDSVKASLQRVAALRLGKVQSGMIGGDRWFTERLAQGDKNVPLVLANGSISMASGTARVNAAQIMGVDGRFWRLSTSGQPVALGADDVAVNESLARKLNIKPGDTIIVRLEKPSAISRDAPLSGAANEDVALRRKVVSIVSAEDFGTFQLVASQVPPDTVFLSLPSLQRAVQMEGRVNALLSRMAITNLEESAGLEDYALKLIRVKTDRPEWELSTDRVFLDGGLVDKLLTKLPQSSGSLT